MRTSLRRGHVLALVLVLAAVISGSLWYRHWQDSRQEQACVAAFEYTLWLDQQGYTGPVQDPTYLRNRDRCLG